MDFRKLKKNDYVYDKIGNKYKVLEVFPYYAALIEGHGKIYQNSIYFSEEEYKEHVKRIQQEKERLRTEQYEARTQLICLLKDKGFIGFIHTTEYENFRHIFEDKFLIPRSQLVNFVDKSNQSVISNTDDFVKNCVRFYYARKTPTNYAANYKNPVMIIFKPEIIYDDNAYFCNITAASRGAKITQDVKEALLYEWDKIFDRRPFSYCCEDDYMSDYYSDYYEDIIAKLKKLRNCEFLIHNKVSIDNAIRIIFKYRTDYEKAIQSFGCDERFIVNQSMFF